MTESYIETFEELDLDYTNSNEEFLDINGVSTKILYLKAVGIPEGTPRNVVILIPGSPGVINYYRRFIGQIYDTWDKKIDIYGIEHMGHTCRKLEGDNILFSNQQQIEAKIAFFDMLKAKPEYAHPDTKFYFLAHSLGAYMVLRLFEERPNSGITKAFLLFPAIHEIEETPRGISTFRFVKTEFERKVASTLCIGLDYIPDLFKQFLAMVFASQSVGESKITAKELLSCQALSNVIHLTQYERSDVKSIEEHFDFIHKHMNELFFYYCVSDGWAPKEHYYLLKEKLPEHTKYNNIILDESDIPHAFVIGENWSRKVAEHIVYDWLKVKERPNVAEAA